MNGKEFLEKVDQAHKGKGAPASFEHAFGVGFIAVGRGKLQEKFLLASDDPNDTTSFRVAETTTEEVTERGNVDTTTHTLSDGTTFTVVERWHGSRPRLEHKKLNGVITDEHTRSNPDRCR